MEYKYRSKLPLDCSNKSNTSFSSPPSCLADSAGAKPDSADKTIARSDDEEDIPPLYNPALFPARAQRKIEQKRLRRNIHTEFMLQNTLKYPVPLVILIFASHLAAQTNTGELRLTVDDESHRPAQASVQLNSEANQYHRGFKTGPDGRLDVTRLPFGPYRVELRQSGFAPSSTSIEIRSSVPRELSLVLTVAPVNTSVTVTDSQTLIDPQQVGSVNRIGAETIADRPASLPGRSIVDLVNSQPGWLYEGNAVLHPRGSEYDVQFVIDGIPLTDNRSPSFGPEIEADDVQSLSIYTSGFPAEYGRKLGGVVAVEPVKDTLPGFHGKIVASGGSYSSASGYLEGQYAWRKNTLTVSLDGAESGHYLNPPVLQNYTNQGTTGNFALRYERDLTDADRITLSVTHSLARFEVPNEQVQQAAGQRQDRAIFETMGIVSYQHIFSPNVVGDLRGMVRGDEQTLDSNPLSTPIVAFQDRSFSEGYLKGTLSIHQGRNEWKAGFESDATNLHEVFSDVITDPTQFDDGTPPTFQFNSKKWDLEQSAFVQDQINLGKWNISAGLRYDHYQLLVNRTEFSPRLGVSRYFKRAEFMVHASYDRVFQTPFFENILLSSSQQVLSLNPVFLRLPVEPSYGNYYEAGVTKGFFNRIRLDVNGFDRRVTNYGDDDQLLNTAISFPITFAKANLYGAEAKLAITHLGAFSGYVSYSFIVGSAYFPVTGGLFLGDDVASAAGVGRFWDSQDQRNTVRARFRYDLTHRFWLAAGGEYGSGLPVDFNGDPQDALAEYGQKVLSRVNLIHGRVSPSLSISASAGYQLVDNEKLRLSLQADGEDLNNRLNVIDFAGLFSGNAIAPQRSYSLRLLGRF